ncbi:MAG: response regulator [Patescibacteria group bacterium]|nr:response regulator [Patescibacteria group bacterium]MDD4610981.1 response regulator [Patescibacteria group bacterium]
MKNYSKKILIVEDEMSLSEALKRKLSLVDGYNIFVAKDGEDGLSLALREKPDLILLDIIMPKMDGMTMLAKLRKEKGGKKIPVIILTNLSDAENVEEAQKRGVNDFLIKSDWKIEDLAKKVKEKLSQ